MLIQQVHDTDDKPCGTLTNDAVAKFAHMADMEPNQKGEYVFLFNVNLCRFKRNHMIGGWDTYGPAVMFHRWFGDDFTYADAGMRRCA